MGPETAGNWRFMAISYFFIFSNRTAFTLSDYYTWTFCHSFRQQVSQQVSHNLKPCDWSTRLPEFSKPVLQYRLGFSKVCEGCVQKCTHLS